jgi:hypothetical protein
MREWAIAAIPQCPPCRLHTLVAGTAHARRGIYLFLTNRHKYYAGTAHKWAVMGFMGTSSAAAEPPVRLHFKTLKNDADEVRESLQGPR